MIPYQVFQIKALIENPAINYIFLRGAGGTAKTHTISKFLEFYEYKHHEYVFLGPTGKSISVAEEKGMFGSTIHRWFGLLKSTNKKDIDQHIYTKFGSWDKYILYMKRKVSDIKLLVIDEISMVNNNILEHILVVLQTIKPELTIILAGDYAQLPPVIIDKYNKFKDLSSSIDIVRDLITYRYMGIVDFITRYRSSNENFNEWLHNFRQGKFQNSFDIANYLRTNFNVYSGELPDELQQKITFLAYAKDAVRDINDLLLQKLPGRSFTSTARFETDIYPRHAAAERNSIIDTFQMDPSFKFKIGSKVLFRVNDPQGFFKNGDEGIVVDVKDKCVMVNKITASGEFLIEVKRHNYKTTPSEIDEGFDISLFQLPFSLGNAMTYHKAQGSGLLFLHLDLEFLNYNNISNEAKWQTLYVGLSRVIDPSKVYIHEKSIKILERQYRLFQQINYNKLNLIFDSVEMQPQHYIPRS